MTATDELRRLLDERGVEWKAPASYDGSTKYDTIVDGYWFHEYDGKITVHGLIPEQAIAATLGRGTLTADDVRDLIERHSDASGGNGRDFHNGAYVAIADELNATLGSGNCLNNCTNSERTGTCHDKGYVYCSERYFVCSSCGCEFDYSDFACEFAEGRSLGNPHYCPNCGARVVDPTTNDVDAEVDA